MQPLLHDTLEDTDATYSELQKLFGAEIAELVDGVTKLLLEMSSQDTAQELPQITFATANDVRILLVKLADRLHNMRTLHFIKSDDKRQRIAHETLDISPRSPGAWVCKRFVKSWKTFPSARLTQCT